MVHPSTPRPVTSRHIISEESRCHIFYVCIFTQVQTLRCVPDALSHIHYVCLGLGDSNYTRYMAVCRGIKRRFKDLGAHDLYKHKEADEVPAYGLNTCRACCLCISCVPCGQEECQPPADVACATSLSASLPKPRPARFPDPHEYPHSCPASQRDPTAFPAGSWVLRPASVCQMSLCA